MQIIAGGMISGVTVFAVIAMMVAMGHEPRDPFITYVAVGVAGMMIVMRFVVPAWIAKTQSQQRFGRAAEFDEDDEVKKRVGLTAIYQTTMIIGYALLEFAAFFCLIAYMSETQLLAVAAAAVLLLIMLASFPTRTRVEDWVENQLQLLRL